MKHRSVALALPTATRFTLRFILLSAPTALLIFRVRRSKTELLLLLNNQ